MKKVYIIRKIFFIHNDLENVPAGLGDVVGVFDEYEQAYQTYLHCEKYEHQQYQISSFELAGSRGKSLIEKTQIFFQKHFHHPTSWKFEDITQIPPLPAEATLAQTEEFIKISGLQYYDLAVHEQMPRYFRIKMSNDFWGDEEEFPFTVFPTEISVLYFLQDSEQEATQEALNVAYSYLWQDMLEETNSDFRGLQGKLTDLSETPSVLETYLQNCTYFWYDEQQQKIRLSYELAAIEDADYTEDLLTVLSELFLLLVLKPFHIEQIDLEAMRNKPDIDS
jgi:hypothetical protein